MRPNNGAHCAKLSAADVVALRAAYAAGEETVTSIAGRYGLRKQTVSKIAFGLTYAWVPGALPPEMARKRGRR